MNGADRKADKSELRAALRAKAGACPYRRKPRPFFLWVEWLKRTEGDQTAKRLLAWAKDASLTIIAYHEYIGEQTI
jgi:hypothetical protein